MDRLKAIRLERKLTQSEFCKICGLKLTQQAYSNYELGLRELPVSVAKTIGRVLKINWWELYE